MQKKLTSAIATFALFMGLSAVTPLLSYAQGQSVPTVSMVTLQTLPGQNGQQMVVTPRGKVVPLPGAGVNGNVVQVYMGSQGGVWYVDRNGQQVDLTPAINAYSNASQTAQVPQYAPQPVVNNYYNQENPNGSSSSSGGGSSAGTAVAAGLGAATGAALTNALMDSGSYYHGVPYGYPVYYGANGQPYYRNASGNNVYVNNSSHNNEFNQANINQNTANVNAAKYNQANVNNVHANALQDQQKWYSQQAANNTSTFKGWQSQNGAAGGGSNPFLHPDSAEGRGMFANAGNAAGGNSDGGGRFGRRNRNNGGGDGQGRFGQGGNGGIGQGDGNGFGNREAFGDRQGGGLGQRSGGFGGRRGGGRFR